MVVLVAPAADHVDVRVADVEARDLAVWGDIGDLELPVDDGAGRCADDHPMAAQIMRMHVLPAGQWFVYVVHNAPMDSFCSK